jgi:hypothetical protein
VTLLLFAIGSYIALKVVFLKDNQVYLQRLSIYVVSPEGAEGGARAPAVVRANQLLCFASFSGEEATLTFDATHPLVLCHEAPREARGPRTLHVLEKEIIGERLEMDRFQRKNVFRLTRLFEAPFGIERLASEVRIRPRAPDGDPSGLALAPRYAAFVRRQGRVAKAEISGDLIKLPPPDRNDGLLSVLSDSALLSDAGRYVHHLLGRYVPEQASVLVLLIRGDRSWHENPGYLAETDVLSLLVIPL